MDTPQPDTIDGTNATSGLKAAASALRIMLYSHDTFGLGHIRRARTIAMALAKAYPCASILIVSGSPIVGRYDFPDGIDFVRVPGVVKLPSGDYVSHNMHIDIAETVSLREEIIKSTALSFRPDLLIVDKEPTGLRGEMLPTLEAVRQLGGRTILGLRDVLDAPDVLEKELEKKNAFTAIESLYDEIWVYGLKRIYEPLAGLPLSESALSKVRYTGYLRREPADWPDPGVPTRRPRGYVLVTPGGGGDGEALIDWVLSAYEHDPALYIPSVIVFGPFMNAEKQKEFERRAHRFRTIQTITFDSRMERLMIDSAGVIAMGGYNTFCEILSFDKQAVIFPRITPRREQFIRAEAAERFGLIRMLPPLSGAVTPDPNLMADAIKGLASQKRPSEAGVEGLLDGLDEVVRLTAQSTGKITA